MAQIIKHRRGSIANVGTLSPVNVGEIILGTGSVGTLNGPVLFVGDSYSYKAVPQLYYGSSVPNISGYGQLDGVSFYDTTGKNLYILASSGSNQRLDLSGAISGSAITPLSVTTGEITGSNLYLTGNAKIDGNITLGGNLTIGDSYTDYVTFASDISSSIIPDIDGAFDLGSDNNYGGKRWRTIYAQQGIFTSASGSFSGSFVGDGSGLTGLATNLSVYGDSGNGSINLLNQNLKVLGTANEIATTVALNSGSDGYTVQIGLPDNVTIGQKLTVLGGLEVTGSSYIEDLYAHSGSFTHQVTIGNGLIVTGSAVIQNAVSASAGWFSGSVYVGGNLTVNGTSTIINSTVVEIGDNIISLNGTGVANAGLVVKDPTSPNTVSGSLLWDSTNDYWIAGPLGTEKRVATYTSASLSTNALLYGDYNNQIASLPAPSLDGQYAKWIGSGWTMTNVIDGGTF